MIELLQAIPEWLGGAVCLAIGWFAKVAYDAWKERKRPYEQDRRRYDYVIKRISPLMHTCFLHTEVPRNISVEAFFENLVNLVSLMLETSSENKPYIDERLKKLEKTLMRALHALEKEACSGDDNDDAELVAKGEELKIAYNAYLDYGNRKFAQKIMQ